MLLFFYEFFGSYSPENNEDHFFMSCFKFLVFSLYIALLYFACHQRLALYNNDFIVFYVSIVMHFFGHISYRYEYMSLFLFKFYPLRLYMVLILQGTGQRFMIVYRL